MQCLLGFSHFILLFFWPRHVACEILVPHPGIEPGPTAVKARSPNHWTARGFPGFPHFKTRRIMNSKEHLRCASFRNFQAVFLKSRDGK